MNCYGGREKKIYGLAVVVVVGMCLVPPWHETFKGSTLNFGYSFIAAPPNALASIDITALAVQILAVAVAAFGVAKFIKRE